jgi:hypothetical protein
MATKSRHMYKYEIYTCVVTKTVENTLPTATGEVREIRKIILNNPSNISRE